MTYTAPLLLAGCDVLFPAHLMPGGLYACKFWYKDNLLLPLLLLSCL